MSRRLMLVAMVLVTAGCGRAGQPGASGTGIEGRVVIESCPAFAETSPCPPKGVRTTVAIEAAEGDRILQVPTGSDGSFRIDLRPGQYLLTARPPASDPHLVALPASAMVERGGYARVTVVLEPRLQEP
jgi:hypothetical protein